MPGGDTVGWGEIEAPISFPTGYMETRRYSSADELELTGFGGGLQRHELVQLSSNTGHNSSSQQKQDRVLVEQGSPCCKQWYLSLSPDFTTKPKA